MRKTSYENTKLTGGICMDLSTLQQSLSCGRSSAERIAKEAGAVVRIGGRRLFLSDKIRAYLNACAENNNEV